MPYGSLHLGDPPGSACSHTHRPTHLVQPLVQKARGAVVGLELAGGAVGAAGLAVPMVQKLAVGAGGVATPRCPAGRLQGLWAEWETNMGKIK